MNTQTVKRPIQAITGSFNRDTGKYRQFIPVPINMDWGSLRPLQDAAKEASDELHGTGVLIANGEHEQSYIVLIENRTSKYMPVGDWMVAYKYNDMDGTYDHELFLAAELIS